MPKNKNAEYRFQMLDRCFSDFRHKYSIEELLEKVNDKLYDANGCASMIKERQLRGDFNAIRKMLPNDIYLEAIPYDGKKCYYRYSEPDFLLLRPYPYQWPGNKRWERGASPQELPLHPVSVG